MLRRGNAVQPLVRKFAGLKKARPPRAQRRDCLRDFKAGRSDLLLALRWVKPTAMLQRDEERWETGRSVSPALGTATAVRPCLSQCGNLGFDLFQRRGQRCTPSRVGRSLRKNVLPLQTESLSPAGALRALQFCRAARLLAHETVSSTAISEIHGVDHRSSTNLTFLDCQSYIHLTRNSSGCNPVCWNLGIR